MERFLRNRPLLLLCLIAPVFSLHAADAIVDCNGKKANNLQTAIDSLSKSVANTVTVSGQCTANIVVSGHADLKLIGTAGASITATVVDVTPGGFPLSTTALTVQDSKVTVQSLTINGGREGVACTSRSTCVIRNATIQGGWGGIGFQDQSSGDILGSTVIQDSLGNGLGIYGASTVNVRPEPWSTPDEAGPVISGHANPVNEGGIGVVILDGSFLRTDNVTISGNDSGVIAQRDANIKIFGGQVSDSLYDGIKVNRGSTAQIYTNLSGNLGNGIFLGPLSFAQIDSTFLDNGVDVFCGHVTSISDPSYFCNN